MSHCYNNWKIWADMERVLVMVSEEMLKRNLRQSRWTFMATRRFWQSTVPMMLPDSSKNGQTWPMTSLFINRTRLIKSGGALENWVPWWAPSRYMKSWLIKILLWRRRTFQMTLSTNQFWSRRAGGSLQSAMTLIPDPSLMTLLILMTEYIWIHHITISSENLGTSSS